MLCPNKKQIKYKYKTSAEKILTKVLVQDDDLFTRGPLLEGRGDAVMPGTHSIAQPPLLPTLNQVRRVLYL